MRITLRRTGETYYRVSTDGAPLLVDIGPCLVAQLERPQLLLEVLNEAAAAQTYRRLFGIDRTLQAALAAEEAKVGNGAALVPLIQPPTHLPGGPCVGAVLIDATRYYRADAGANSLNLKLSPSTTASASRVRFWLIAGTSLAVFALARPQYGRLEEPVFDQSREILLAIDLSRSMLAPDVKPSRLERAKLLIQSLLEKLEGERVGLVVFAGTAFLQSPLSADYEILREFLPALGPDYLPQGGSNYGALLDASLQAFSHTNAADRFLMILSDGEATDDDWKKRTEELKKKNIRVLGLGVGTLGGAMLPDGTGGFVKDERGAVVLSKLETGTLQELAAATGGVYRDASGWLDLAGLVKETVEAGRKGQFLEKNTIRLAERFQWPLALGLWCLLVSFYSEFPVRPRPRDLKLTPHIKPPTPSSAPRPLTATLVSLAFCSLVIGPWASGITPAKPAAAAPAAPADTPPPASEALAKIIGRVAAAESRTARDWAELGRETVTWGGRLQSEQQPIPEGPVRDALAAVDAGAKLDAKTADWTKHDNIFERGVVWVLMMMGE